MRGWAGWNVPWGSRDSTPTSARARALVGVGWLATLQGEFDRAESSLTEALRLAVAVEDRMTEATVRDALALLELHRGRYDQAATWIEGALELYRESESTSIAGPQYVSNAYARMGQIALARGDISGASVYLEEALRQRRDQGFIWGLSDTLRSLGDLARDRGDLDGAMVRYAESVTTAREHGDRLLFANAFSGIAGVAAARGQAERAARLYGAAAALRGELGVPDEGQEGPTHDRGEAQVRSALSPEAFASARTAGAALSLADAIAEALAEAELTGASDAVRRARSSGLGGPDGARRRGTALARSGPFRPRNRRGALHQPAHRQRPCLPPPRQARRRVPQCRRRLCRPPRTGLNTSHHLPEKAAPGINVDAPVSYDYSVPSRLYAPTS